MRTDWVLPCPIPKDGFAEIGQIRILPLKAYAVGLSICIAKTYYTLISTG